VQPQTEAQAARAQLQTAVGAAGARLQTAAGAEERQPTTAARGAARGLAGATGASRGPAVQTQGAVDVWEDAPLLCLLQGQGYYPPDGARAERDRLQHRARQYSWRDGHLVRCLQDGSTRVVPRVAERGPLVRDVHEQAGHFGVRKTLSLLRPHYWWVGLSADVAGTVKGCGACDRVKASFNAKHPTLQPLPIKGLFYCWGLDFAGPLPKSRRIGVASRLSPI
jgi:hypothetical protein